MSDDTIHNTVEIDADISSLNQFNQTLQSTNMLLMDIALGFDNLNNSSTKSGSGFGTAGSAAERLETQLNKLRDTATRLAGTKMVDDQQFKALTDSIEQVNTLEAQLEKARQDRSNMTVSQYQQQIQMLQQLAGSVQTNIGQVNQQLTLYAASANQATQALSGMHGIVNQLGGSLGLHTQNLGLFGNALNSIAGAAGPVGLGVAGIATALIGLGVAAGEAAAAVEHQENVLKGFLENRGQGEAFAPVIEQFDQMRDKAKLVGASYTDMIEAFRRGYEHTDDAAHALETVSIAMNIAQINGQSFHTVLNRLDSAYEGQFRGLKVMGIHIDDTTAAYLRLLPQAERTNEINALLKEKFSADLPHAFDDYASHQAKLEANLDRLKLNIGKGVIPVLDGMVTALNSVGDTMAKLNKEYDWSVDASGAPILVPKGAMQSGKMQIGLSGAVSADWAPSASPQENVQPGAGPGGLGTNPREGQMLPENQRITNEAHAAMEAKKQAEEAASYAARDIRKEYSDRLEGARQQQHELDQISEDAAKKEERALQERTRQVHAAFEAEKALEADRHTTREREIRDGEHAEEQALEDRKTAATNWAQHEIKEIEKKRDADVHADDVAEQAEMRSFEKRSQNENNRYTIQQHDLQEEVRARQQAVEHEKRDIDDVMKTDIEARESRKRTVVDGLKAEELALQHRKDEEIHGIDEVIRKNEDATKASIELIKTETAAYVTGLQERGAALDEDKKLRDYGQKTEDAQYTLDQAKKKLDTTKADPTSTKDDISKAEHDVYMDRRKQSDVFYDEEIRRQKEALGGEVNAVKDAATKQEQAEAAGVEVVKRAEEQKKYELQQTFDIRKELIAAAIQEEERSAASQVQIWRDAATKNKQALDDQLQDFKNAKDAEKFANEQAHKDTLQGIKDEKDARHDQFEQHKFDVKEAAKEHIGQVNAAKEIELAAVAESLRETKAKWLGIKDAETDAHNSMTRNISTRETEMNNSLARQTTAIHDQLEAAKREHAAAWGNEPGGAVFELKKAEDAALATIDAEKRRMDEMKTSGEHSAAAWADVAAKIATAASAAHNFAQTYPGAGGMGAIPGAGMGGAQGGGMMMAYHPGAGGGGLGPTQQRVMGYSDQVAAAARKAGVPEGEVGQFTSMALAIMENESGGDPSKENAGGDRGLFQINPIHTSVYGQAADPSTNINYAVPMMAQAWNKGAKTPYELYSASGSINPGATPEWLNANRSGGYQGFNDTLNTNSWSYYNQMGGAGSFSAQQGAASPWSPLDPNLTPYQGGAENRADPNRPLTEKEAWAACGPAAAVAFARIYGRNPTLPEATHLAETNKLWDVKGMHGYGSEAQLMGAMGIQTEQQSGVDWDRVQAEIAAGNPVALSTPEHYFTATGYNKQTGQYYVGNSGMVLSGQTHSPWLTGAQITAQGGGSISGTIYGRGLMKQMGNEVPDEGGQGGDPGPDASPYPGRRQAEKGEGSYAAAEDWVAPAGQIAMGPQPGTTVGTAAASLGYSGTAVPVVVTNWPTGYGTGSSTTGFGTLSTSVPVSNLPAGPRPGASVGAVGDAGPPTYLAGSPDEYLDDSGAINPFRSGASRRAATSRRIGGEVSDDGTVSPNYAGRGSHGSPEAPAAPPSPTPGSNIAVAAVTNRTAASFGLPASQVNDPMTQAALSIFNQSARTLADEQTRLQQSQSDSALRIAEMSANIAQREQTGYYGKPGNAAYQNVDQMRLQVEQERQTAILTASQRVQTEARDAMQRATDQLENIKRSGEQTVAGLHLIDVDVSKLADASKSQPGATNRSNPGAFNPLTMFSRAGAGISAEDNPMAAPENALLAALGLALVGQANEGSKGYTQLLGGTPAGNPFVSGSSGNVTGFNPAAASSATGGRPQAEKGGGGAALGGVFGGRSSARVSEPTIITGEEYRDEILMVLPTAHKERWGAIFAEAGLATAAGGGIFGGNQRSQALGYTPYSPGAGNNSAIYPVWYGQPGTDSIAVTGGTGNNLAQASNWSYDVTTADGYKSNMLVWDLVRSGIVDDRGMVTPAWTWGNDGSLVPRGSKYDPAVIAAEKAGTKAGGSTSGSGIPFLAGAGLVFQDPNVISRAGSGGYFNAATQPYGVDLPQFASSTAAGSIPVGAAGALAPPGSGVNGQQYGMTPVNLTVYNTISVSNQNQVDPAFSHLTNVYSGQNSPGYNAENPASPTTTNTTWTSSTTGLGGNIAGVTTQGPGPDGNTIAAAAPVTPTASNSVAVQTQLGPVGTYAPTYSPVRGDGNGGGGDLRS